jgi:hypothetical protein
VLDCKNCGLRGTKECQCKYIKVGGIELMGMFHPGFKAEMMKNLKKDSKKE